MISAGHGAESDKGLLKWFGEEIEYKGGLVWSFIYTLRIREQPLDKSETPLYNRIEHRLYLERGRPVLEVLSPEGLVLDRRALGSVAGDIDAGALLVEMIYAYLRSYRERARGLGAVVYEYIDPENVYTKIFSVARSLRPPVVAGLLETVVFVESGPVVYSQLALHINWVYILD